MTRQSRPGGGWRGAAGLGGHGEAGRGRTRQSKLGVVRRDEARRSTTRQARRGEDGQVGPGMFWQGFAGEAMHEAARQGKEGYGAASKAGPGLARTGPER